MEEGLKDIIKVLVVEDSPSISVFITSILNSDPQIRVVASAYNGKEAVELASKLKPDIITMDIHMPIMDGFEATKQIMAYSPTPILIVSASVFTADMNKVFKAMSYGAIDVVDKNDLLIKADTQGIQLLITKVKFLSKIKVVRHPLARLEAGRGGVVRFIDTAKQKVQERIVAIVSSTGGPQALLDILKRFPRDFPCGIVIVQHITTGFDTGLAEWLAGECQIKVKIAQDSEKILPAVAYVAPCEIHMKVAPGAKIYFSNEPPLGGHRPSGDVLLESVAQVYKEGAVAAILTGMGSDGANGMKAIKNMHGVTIAQDEASCVIFGMPKAAISMGVVDKVLPLESIAGEIAGSLN